MALGKSLLSKKIPTLIGIAFLIGGLAVGVFVLDQGTGGFLPKASPETTPKQVKVTNVTDTSFSVSFVTDTATPGFLRHGIEPNNLSTQTPDDRDQLTGTVEPFVVHHITVRGLTPSTRYYFSIGTGTRDLFDDNGQPYVLTTASRVNTSPNAATAYGTVLTSSQSPAGDSIVYLEIEGAAPLSALVRSSGSWAVPVGTARNTSLSAYATFTDQTPAKINVISKDSRQTASLNEVMANSKPFPVITLGSSATAPGTPPLPSSPPTGSLSSPTPQPTTTPTGGTTDGTGGGALQLEPIPESDQSRFSENQLQVESLFSITESRITFLNPKTEGEQLNTTKPEFKGTAPPNTELTIKIESDPIFQQVITSDAQGNWSYTPPSELSPGTHTLTVSYVDSSGGSQQEVRQFTILAQGSSTNPAFTSTPSGQTTTPTPTPTPAPTTSPSSPATQSGTQSTGSAQTTTPSSTDTGRTSIATGPAQPKSGGGTLSLVMLGLGMIAVLSGLFSWQYAVDDTRSNSIR